VTCTFDYKELKPTFSIDQTLKDLKNKMEIEIEMR